MNRKQFLGSLFGIAAASVAAACDSATGPRPELFKTREEWRSLLPAPVYAVLFEGRTEPAGSSPLNDEWREGTYLCAACLSPVFTSATKFESGTGWPSFWETIDGRISTSRGLGASIGGTEYHCKRCFGHHGHLFSDGPAPTGRRYCNNGLALHFVPAGAPLPPLRS